ncbi:acid protease [Lichtheimia hyalospora FSU 10163]|nr:acid protease [Lichtheimia hyalospora FSU 10163]
MRLSCIALATLAVFFGADAAAVPVTENNNVIRLPLVRKENGQLAHLKRGMLEKRADKTSLYNAVGREYMVEIGVGTPAQKFNLTLDTGSAELWIPSTGCSATECPYERFDASRSSSYQKLTEPFSIEYGIGQAKGVYGIDTVTVGNAKVDKQKVALVSSTKDILGMVDSGEQSNGIMGLGYPGLNTVRGVKDDTPFVFNLAKTLQDPVFSIYLNEMFAYGSTGEIMFGGEDQSKYKGTLQSVPVVDYDTSGYLVKPNVGSGKKGSSSGTYLYWTVPGQGIKASGYEASLPSNAGFILDTGTTLTMVPKKYADGIVKAIAGTGKYAYDAANSVYRVDCSIAKQDKTVDFEISTSTSNKVDKPVVISTPVSQLVIPIDTDYLDTARSCMFGITVSGTGLTDGETWIIGEASLRSMYTVYNMEKNTVSLAPAIHTTDSAAAAAAAPTGSNNNSTSANPSNANPSATAQPNDNNDDDDDIHGKIISMDHQDESAASAFSSNVMALGAVTTSMITAFLLQ